MTAIKPETIERIAKAQTGLNAAERAIMLEDTRRILAKEDAVADAVHRRAFGDNYKPPSDDEMGDIHVGDTTIYQSSPPTQTAATIMDKQPASTLPAIAMAALLSTGIGGLAGYLMADKDSPDVPAFDYESVNIGLGRIEDYIKED